MEMIKYVYVGGPFDGQTVSGPPGTAHITRLYYDEEKREAGNRTYRVKYSNDGRIFVIDEKLTDEEGRKIICKRYHLRGVVV